ncbi:MAG: hypothetical protein A3F72_03620 [Bacteroidetes bacterium RIFCSPLOWO2_12_FULL_35_15]|nr:MAG: hypothetical protein A3F72_03620 [Bacteroidetes bacterium RIFCSPLOWO2_12_FULL_35_15]
MGDDFVATETKYKTLHDVEHGYVLVNTPEKETVLLSKLNSCTYFVFDTETGSTEFGSALEIHSLELVGISFAFAVGEAFYLPVPEDIELADKLLHPYKIFFENPDILKIGHNLKFDINVMRRYGISVNGKMFDTIIAHYLYDSNSLHGLKELSKSMLGYQQIEIQDLIGAGKHQMSMRDVEPIEAAVYANEDADQTLQLHEKLTPLLKKRNLEQLFANIEIPLIKVLADMEYEGIKVDAEILYYMEEEARTELDLLQGKIFEAAGTDFTINSNIDLAAVLFEELGLEPILKTKTGANSVSKKVLKKLEREHPIIPLLLKYKSALSVVDNFLSKLPMNIHPVTERVHTNFKQDRVVTGRLSSANPNLQNIPKQDEGFGKQIRKAFVARDENHVIVSADYSQIELRVIAHYSKDPVMIEAFKNDEDIHQATAAKIFKVAGTEVTSHQRKIAKTINFGLNYLMSAKTLAERISDATGETIEVSDAQGYMDRYFAEFKGVEAYQEEAYYLATIHGYSTTLFGRRRYLPDIDSPFKFKRMSSKRLAVNTPIQGSSADIIKIAMVELHKELSLTFKTKMVLQIHDELVFDVPKDELDRVIPIIKRVMEGAVQLDVPLKVEINHGENWLEAH